MEFFQDPQKYIRTKEQVVENFLGTEYDLLEIERLFNDMVKHYVHPHNDWNLSPYRIAEVFENSEVIEDLIRGLIRAQQHLPKDAPRP
jgi:hypothetical protein